MKHVDEYHLTGISLDIFVSWQHRPPSSTEGRGENRGDSRGENKSKHEENKPEKPRYSEGLVSRSVVQPFQDKDFMMLKGKQLR